MQQFDRVAQSFGKFFNADVLSEVLSLKADSTVVEQLLNQKASCQELFKCSAMID